MKPSLSATKPQRIPMPEAREYRFGAVLVTTAVLAVLAVGYWLLEANYYLASLFVLWVACTSRMLAYDVKSVTRNFESFNFLCLISLTLSLIVSSICFMMPFLVDISHEFSDLNMMVWLVTSTWSLLTVGMAAYNLRHLRKKMPSRKK